MFISKVSICDRLKQRYGNSQQNWQRFFLNQENNTEDLEFIQYIVNFIIEQSKHNIVLSELPDVIQTLHCEADAILRKNKIITLEEVIAQVQMIGAMKYPYLKKLKPITAEDFIKEVIREVFERLGSMITLDMIENICQFTSCSTKQLLLAMPSIDVDEAATLIIEDISRNQHDHKQGDVLKKIRSLSNLSMKGMINRKFDDMPISINKERIRSEHESSKLIKNSQQLQEQYDIPIEKNPSKSNINPSNSHRSSKNINKNQINSSEKQLLELQESTNHFNQTIIENPFVNNSPYQSTKISKSINSLSSTLKNKFINREKYPKIKITRSKSNTQTYSIHSEEGLFIQTDKPTVTSISNINDNAISNMFIKPIRSLNKNPEKFSKEISSQTTSCTNIASSFDEDLYSKDRLTMIETIHNSNLKEKFPSIHHYNKYGCQDSIINNDDEICPLENIVTRRFIQQI